MGQFAPPRTDRFFIPNIAVCYHLAGMCRFLVTGERKIQIAPGPLNPTVAQSADACCLLTALHTSPF
jgi:hypothetical protein